MVELIERERGTGGKQLEDVKIEFINERLEEIWCPPMFTCVLLGVEGLTSVFEYD